MMGRAEFHAADRQVSIKLSVTRVHLNSQGYDSYGAYWGRGMPLWELQVFSSAPANNPAGEVVRFFLRAPNREEAKITSKHSYPNARFYR